MEVNVMVLTSSEADKKIDEYEISNHTIRHFKLNSSEVETQRKPRTIDNGPVTFGLVCLSCFANPSQGSWNCYSGYSVPTKKCADAEQCYTELNPLYIRRGCILPGRVNRTFICKCPLCNDKPSFEMSHYEYKKLSDWEYDNARLQAPLIGLDLMCKVCETKGSNPASDKNCRSGKNADYMKEAPKNKKQSSTETNVTPKTGFLQLAKDLKLYTKSDQKDFTPGRNITDADGELSDPRRSCIMCDNIATEECNDPRNKLITSMMCERDDDLCYSLHTPFGIVNRGCFNINHNLTTYVCSCNLCNYISISEMPFMFAKKGDWVGNVIELSRTKHFRKSVFKDMSCLRCEVNTTTRKGDMLESANCLEGNIGNLPVEDCDVDEICGVKSLRADGYIWRGCLKVPLYNYWWTVCDNDLCNYDTRVLLYDFII
ncbi:hypothetical protein PYW07_003349 [Mythimna separata]|uniref:Uncharacterized protein n=1 Tax=Mythimna separata TaxID=271217 RepID=A0AAD7YHY6_MYTSE|nr:hypothetical protein PYW07_003349 [Mythimna separata]